MKNYSSEKIVNIGTGFDYSIKKFADIISKEVSGDFVMKWDKSRTDGTFEKRTDIKRLMKVYPEFNPRSLKDGIKTILGDDKKISRILSFS